LKLKVTIDGKTYEVEVEATESEPRRPGYITPAGGVAHTRGAAPSVARVLCAWEYGGDVSWITVRLRTKPGAAGTVLYVWTAGRMPSTE
jgi:hypothetical protein